MGGNFKTDSAWTLPVSTGQKRSVNTCRNVSFYSVVTGLSRGVAVQNQLQIGKIA
jgi:hypothetical protein